MKESFVKNRTGILMMLCSSVCVCFGQYFWKLSENSILWLIVGFALYGAGALIMLLAYRHGSLSVLQPMLSANYILGMIIAVTLLGEMVRWYNLLGVLLVLIGVVLIAGGDEETTADSTTGEQSENTGITENPEITTGGDAE